MLFDYVLRFADSDLVLAQRLGEWVGHGPVLEEDIALTNVQHHGSQRYFRNALITARGHRAVRLWYGSDHGTVGWWKA